MRWPWRITVSGPTVTMTSRTVSDVAVTTSGYSGYTGEAMAMGERTPIAIVDSAAAARMAVGEALTNLASAPVEGLTRVKLSANWMAAAGHPGEDAALYDTVAEAVPLAQSGEHQKKALLIISDGNDTNSSTPVRQLKQLVRDVEDLTADLDAGFARLSKA